MSSDTLLVDGVAWHIEPVRHSSARRITLRLDEWSPVVHLTLPSRAALRPALAWAREQGPAVRRLAARRPVARPFRDGALVPLEGRERPIVHEPGRRRTDLGTAADGAIRVGGEETELANRVTRALKARAKVVLMNETRTLADAHGLALAAVSVGDPASRWGSCSSTARIRYSWRLILMPPEVRAAIVAHEVTHLIHPNHGPMFHVEHERLLGRAPVVETAWLKANGRAIQGFGRGA